MAPRGSARPQKAAAASEDAVAGGPSGRWILSRDSKAQWMHGLPSALLAFAGRGVSAGPDEAP